MKIKLIENAANTEPNDDFLGLTPEHLHVILYSPLDEMQHIVCFNSSFDPSLLEEVDVVKKVTLLIKLIGDAREAKATQNGYLPKKIVNALYDFQGLDKFTVLTEEYAPSILALRHAVTDCGWLKKRSGRFSLTKKGEHIFRNGFLPSHYVVLLKYWMRNYNWAFTDGYSACSIVQQSAVFSLYLLLKRAQESILAENFTELFIRAFPYALEEVAAEPDRFERTVEERLGTIIHLRFLKRFAAYFGLIDYFVDEKLPYLERDIKAQVKTTQLFAATLRWFPSEKQKCATVIQGISKDLLH